MRVVGTAGHVDHGKSSLVQALTGVHPDRLKEEQAREMTIDLGFAWYRLPGGEEIGIVDVPGHRDFIENMLAGVGGIDAVLFVIAADEGIMPQTREHLAILDLLQIQRGVIVLNKIDLTPDQEWLDLVEADVRETVVGTVLGKAPLVRVSARTGAGLEELTKVLSEVIENSPTRPDLGRPRLPVDRVFTVAGFGTVVTGTLSDGSFQTGDEVEVLPEGLRGRIRGLQSHKRKGDRAVPGSRTAINISGVDVEQIRRGNVVAKPGTYQPTQRLDVQFRLLPDASSGLRHSTEVKLFTGASESVARMRLLGSEQLLPGEEGWLQLETQDRIVAARGDRFILRRPSPGETLGGGVVLETHPPKRHKRFDENVLDRLKSLQQGSPAEIFIHASQAIGPASIQEVAEKARLAREDVEAVISELLISGAIIVLGNGSSSERLVMTAAEWMRLTERAAAETGRYHQMFPLRRGIGREELKSRLKCPARLFNAVMARWLEEDRLVESGTMIAAPEHKIQFSTQQQSKIRVLLERFAAAPYGPPSAKETQAELGEEVFGALIDHQILVAVSSEVVFRKADYQHMLEWVERQLEADEQLTVVQFRDAFNTSRKYALAFLEHLDAIGVTVREGDYRKRKLTR